MSRSILSLAAVVLLAATSSAQSCHEWSGDTSISGSTTAAQKLDYYHTDSGQLHNNEKCTWDITCPAGSFIGFTKFDFHLQAGGFVKFLDIDSGTPLDTYTPGLLGVGTAQQMSQGWEYRNALYSTVNKLRVVYNSSASGSVGYGFRLMHQCYTSKCPKEMVPYKTFSTAARSGFTLYADVPVPGTECAFSFTCAADPSDTLRVHRVKRYYQGKVQMSINSTGPTNHLAIPMGGGSGAFESTLPAATSYTVTYKAPAAADISFSGNSQVQVDGFCQPVGETTCKHSLIRNGATLSDGAGTIAMSPLVGSGRGAPNGCSYKVQCPSDATGIFFVGGDSDVSVSATSGGTPVQTWVADPSGQAVPQLPWQTKPLQYHFNASTSAYVAWSATSTIHENDRMDVLYTCTYPTCASASSGLHGQTKSLPSTTLLPDTLIPQTDESQTFASGSLPGQNCSYAVTCPAGFSVLLNVSSPWVDATDSWQPLIATGGDGKTYEVRHTSLITTTNALSWKQGTGFTVGAGCTSFVAGTCPVATKQLSALSTATLGTNATLDTWLGENPDGGGAPIGYSCDFPIACPAGSYIKLILKYGFHHPSDVPIPNRPTFKNSNGGTVSYDSSSVGWVHLGVQSATVSWKTTEWPLNSGGATNGRLGFYLNASCDSEMGTVFTTTTTAGPATAAGDTTPAATPATGGTAAVASTTAASTTAATAASTTAATAASTTGITVKQYTTSECTGNPVATYTAAPRTCTSDSNKAGQSYEFDPVTQQSMFKIKIGSGTCSNLGTETQIFAAPCMSSCEKKDGETTYSGGRCEGSTVISMHGCKNADCTSCEKRTSLPAGQCVDLVVENGKTMPITVVGTGDVGVVNWRLYPKSTTCATDSPNQDHKQAVCGDCVGGQRAECEGSFDGFSSSGASALAFTSIMATLVAVLLL